MFDYNMLFETKQNGENLSREQLDSFVSSLVGGEINDQQLGALLMLFYLKGLSTEETQDLASLMSSSGYKIDREQYSKMPLDKHSTGGVGDKVSLLLAPMLAAVDDRVCVPMISGRALGHTGGTLDKLETIPGFSVQLSPEKIVESANKIGLVIAEQSDSMVPADKILYAARHITNTIDSIPLIVSSIMSKKLAEGLEGLVLDVKYGSGAFLKTLSEAQELGELSKLVGDAAGTKTSIVYSRMDTPIGYTVGNALEVREAVEQLPFIVIQNDKQV